jgi:hypothetical protein
MERVGESFAVVKSDEELMLLPIFFVFCVMVSSQDAVRAGVDFCAAGR